MRTIYDKHFYKIHYKLNNPKTKKYKESYRFSVEPYLNNKALWFEDNIEIKYQLVSNRSIYLIYAKGIGFRMIKLNRVVGEVIFFNYYNFRTDIFIEKEDFLVRPIFLREILLYKTNIIQTISSIGTQKFIKYLCQKVNTEILLNII